MQSFLEDVVKSELSKSTKRFDAAWEAKLGWVWLHPWMSIIRQQFLKPLVHMVLKSLENLLTKSTGEGAYRNYDMVVRWKTLVGMTFGASLSSRSSCHM